MRGLQPKNKVALAFGSYGWRPGVFKQIQQVFDELGWQSVEPFEEKIHAQIRFAREICRACQGVDKTLKG